MQTIGYLDVANSIKYEVHLLQSGSLMRSNEKLVHPVFKVSKGTIFQNRAEIFSLVLWLKALNININHVLYWPGNRKPI